jgi:hypothetical protein
MHPTCWRALACSTWRNPRDPKATCACGRAISDPDEGRFWTVDWGKLHRDRLFDLIVLFDHLVHFSAVPFPSFLVQTGGVVLASAHRRFELACRFDFPTWQESQDDCRQPTRHNCGRGASYISEVTYCSFGVAFLFYYYLPTQISTNIQDYGVFWYG